MADLLHPAPLRTTCMVQKPSVYEVSGCPQCNGDNTTWSEYQGHIWCFDCQIDYAPKHNGIFDGFIPINLAREMGISFDRIDIATGKRIPFTETSDEPISALV